MSLFGGGLYGSMVWGPVIAITGFHLSVALLFGMFSFRGSCPTYISYNLRWRQLGLEGSHNVSEAALCPQAQDALGGTSDQAHLTEKWVTYFLFLLLHQTSLREFPKMCRIAAFVCLICKTNLWVPGLGKDHPGWLQPDGVLINFKEFVLSWLSTTNAFPPTSSDPHQIGFFLLKHSSWVNQEWSTGSSRVWSLPAPPRVLCIAEVSFLACWSGKIFDRE